MKVICLTSFVHGALHLQTGAEADFPAGTATDLVNAGLVREASNEAVQPVPAAAADQSVKAAKAARAPANKKAPEPENKKVPEPEAKKAPEPQAKADTLSDQGLPAAPGAMDNTAVKDGNGSDHA